MQPPHPFLRLYKRGALGEESRWIGAGWMGLAARGQGDGTKEEASNKLATGLQYACNLLPTMGGLRCYYGATTVGGACWCSGAVPGITGAHVRARYMSWFAWPTLFGLKRRHTSPTLGSVLWQ